MLSRRDYQKRLRKMEQKNEHFSIRKLSVGAASVLIGLSFLGFNTHSAQAAEKTDTDTNTATKNKSGSITDNTKTFTVGDATEASNPKVNINTDKDGNVQMSTTGTPLIQPNDPVAPIPADTKKGESSVGDAAETPSNPKVVINTDKDGNVQMSTTGTPLIQPNNPAYSGGVADSDPTSYELPEAKIPASSASSQAPSSSAASSASSSASSEASVSSAASQETNPVVATTNTVNTAAHQVSTPVASHAAVNTVNHGTVVTNNQNQSKALPQTGAKANMAGMLGLMLASVGAVLGLAVTKKHEN